MNDIEAIADAAALLTRSMRRLDLYRRINSAELVAFEEALVRRQIARLREIEANLSDWRFFVDAGGIVHH